MKKALLIIIGVACFSSSYAQSAEDSVKTVINQLFAAMKASDAAALQACFADSAILQTITGKGAIKTEAIAGFAKQVASLPNGAADERIRFDLVKVDDALAIAWTPYQFYFAGTYSHCGVNSFQLVRQRGQWKIQYIIDTRRKTCD